MTSLVHGDQRRVSAFELSDRGRNRWTREDPRARSKGRRPWPEWICAILRIPLELKLLGANLVIMLTAVAMLLGPFRLQPARVTDTIVVVSALVVGAIVNFFLVRVALRPINSMTQVAWLVSQGLLGARVPASLTADRELTQLSTIINELLDDLVAERDEIAHLREAVGVPGSATDRLRGIASVNIARARS